jgi:VanZ family protein
MWTNPAIWLSQSPWSSYDLGDNLVRRPRGIANSRIARWTLVAVWALVIFAFSCWQTLPSLGPSLVDVLIKKTAHFIEFGILAVLFARALSPDAGKQYAQITAFALLFTLIWATLDEIHQALTPGRSPRISDIFIDFAGAVVFLVGRRSLDHNITK